ncbi:MAG: Lrp/AsnC family transcriptional regulator [Lentisphaerae bacterium]|nr:Lrp/AsnC family transcriptional regulator [Lentisphaerota bacterium]MBQ4329307.1 Lrp/AsnC family transcriptional regulator [Lentisphaeria bacterium]MBR2719918.1 Lrp/AsnC family transcriptional regulator [Lentisphaeria bacterium]
MKEKIISLLRTNARLTAQEIAEILSVETAEVVSAVNEMENAGVIRGYTAIVTDDAPGSESRVKALIEVKVTPSRDGGFDRVARRIAKFPEVTDLSLLSGSYDLLLTVEGASLQQVANFVSDKLATIEGVISTATSFQLKKYKESGMVMQSDEEYERLKICF